MNEGAANHVPTDGRLEKQGFCAGTGWHAAAADWHTESTGFAASHVPTDGLRDQLAAVAAGAAVLLTCFRPCGFGASHVPTEGFILNAAAWI
mmetsp:Transcript_48840/g.130736  ORF Transcript_48840/g.130736 Transcript_48840/m.130736 type:complete len:92 (+) Transcript_48840:363-638(+)